MKKYHIFCSIFLTTMLLLSCKNNSKDNNIQFSRENRSTIYEVHQIDWKDTFRFPTTDYDTGIPYILDTSRNILFIFDNMLFLYKLNSKFGIVMDSVNLLSGYTYRMAPERNKLLYAYPNLFFYHEENILQFDTNFNLIFKYGDSIYTELTKRLPYGYYHAYYIDSTNIILPDKLWVRLNDYHGCTEEMIFGVSVQMEPPVIHSTYIVR